MADSFAEDALAAVIVIVVLVAVAVAVAFGAGALLAVAATGFEWGADTLGVVL